MAINWMRYGLTIIAVFMAYFVFYEGSMALLGLSEAMAEHMRAPDDPVMGIVFGGHFLQTLMMVTLFYAFVRTRDVKVGALYGLMMGVYYCATQLTLLGAKAYPEALLWDFMPLHLVAGIVCAGIVPALLYREPASALEVDAPVEDAEHA